MSVLNIGISEAGFTRDRLPEILAKLQVQARGIYGSDIDLTEATPDGQFLGILAEVIDDTGQAIEDTYNGRNPNAATGQNLTSTCTLNGVYRIVGSFSYVDVQALITVGAVVPAGTQVQDEDTGAVYAFSVAATGIGTPQTVTCVALVKGTYSAAGKVTKIVTPTYGLQTVTNASPSTVVDAEESDERLRIRRNQSTAAPTNGFIDSLLAGLLAVPGIGKLKIYENDTGAYKDIKAGDQVLRPHSVAVVVTGGSASLIGEALALRKTPGVSTVGNTDVTVNDSLGIPHVLKYEVALEEEFFVKISYRERPGAGFGGSGGEEAVKAALVAWVETNQLPSDNVYRGFLWAEAQGTVLGPDGLPAIVVEDVQLGRTELLLASTDLALAWSEIGILPAANVIFEVLP